MPKDAITIELPKATPRMADDPTLQRCVIRIPVELHAALKAIAKSHRLTVSELMTAAGQELVRQYQAPA